MNNDIWNSFYSAMMEKTALVGSALYGGLSLLTLKDRTKELEGKSRITPTPGSQQSLKLGPSTSYQFGGGKKMGLNQNTTPNRF